MRTTNGQRVEGTTTDISTSATASAPVRVLSAQLKELRRLATATKSPHFQQALAVAQGENLAVRRKLAAYE